MAKVSPQEFVEKWARRTQQATQDYERGVSRVTEAPGAKAAQNKAAYLTNVQASANKWAENVGSVSLSDWKTATMTKGAARIAQGVQAAAPKMGQTAANLLAAVDAAVAEAKSTPRGTFEQNMQRAMTYARRMHETRIKR